MNPAAIPAPVQDVQGDDRWMCIHNRFIAEAKEREPEVLFIGDSLIQQIAWSEQWDRMFVPLHCLNFGIGGDQTQHVLWRLLNGELENLSPKVIVLLIGTNNHDHTALQVAEGTMEIVKVITTKQPQANLVVMGIPPRGQYPNKLREKIAAINQMVMEKLPEYSNAVFLNVDPALFINEIDKTISHHDMHDYLHFTTKGYQKLLEPLLDELQNLLKNFMTADCASAGDMDN